MATNYYKLLEVDRQASLDVIEAAYRRLALRYHPDRNPSLDATARMQEINEAFAVLRDPARRQQYDQFLYSALQAAQARQAKDEWTARNNRTSQSDPRDIAVPHQCQSCGASDATLRYASFPYVVSFLILTLRRAWGGLYCETCRQSEMSKAKTITLIFGWWGIPFGPIFSLGSIFESSAGKIPSDINAAYLRNLGVYFIRNGDLKNAREALQASLKYEHNEEVANLYSHVFNDSTTETPQGANTKTTQGANAKTTQDVKVETGGKGDVIFGAVMATILFLALAGIVFMYRPGGPGHQSLTVDQSSAPAAAAASATDNRLPTAIQEPPPTSTPIPAIFGVAKAMPVAVRQGPGNQYPRIQRSFRPEERFLILGQYANCQWLEISTDTIESAWILMDDTKVDMSIDCSAITPVGFHLESSVIYQRADLDNHNELRITNEGTRDSVVYLVFAAHHDFPFAIAYVRSTESYSIKGIPDGTYSLFYRSGSDWDGTHFLKNETVKRGVEDYMFEETPKQDSNAHPIWLITLDPISDGNTPVIDASEADIPEIPFP